MEKLRKISFFLKNGFLKNFSQSPAAFGRRFSITVRVPDATLPSKGTPQSMRMAGHGDLFPPTTQNNLLDL